MENNHATNWILPPRALPVVSIPYHGTPIQSIHELRPLFQSFFCLGVREPLASSLMLFWPRSLLRIDNGLEKLIGGFGGFGGELVEFPLLGNEAQVIFDGADYAGLFPGLPFGSILSRGFVVFPAALGKNPAALSCGLDEENVVFVFGEGDNAGDETLALGSVACVWRVSTCCVWKKWFSGGPGELGV